MQPPDSLSQGAVLFTYFKVGLRDLFFKKSNNLVDPEVHMTTLSVEKYT